MAPLGGQERMRRMCYSDVCGSLRRAMAKRWRCGRMAPLSKETGDTNTQRLDRGQARRQEACRPSRGGKIPEDTHSAEQRGEDMTWAASPPHPCPDGHSSKFLTMPSHHHLAFATAHSMSCSAESLHPQEPEWVTCEPRGCSAKELSERPNHSARRRPQPAPRTSLSTLPLPP